MANLENLKKAVPFVKDDPRINRAGAPKTKLLKDVLTAELQTESNGIDNLTAIIKKLTTMAVKGDLNAIKEVLDRYAGKSTQHTDITTKGDKVEAVNLSSLTDAQLRSLVEIQTAIGISQT